MRKLTAALFLGLTATAALAQTNAPGRVRYEACLAQAKAEPAKAIDTAVFMMFP